MSRDMRLANKTVFGKLVRHCAARGVQITRPSAPRWVASTPESREVLKNVKVLESISFGRFRHLAWLRYDDVDYLATIGFEAPRNALRLVALEDIEGYDVCLLAELPVLPKISSASIKNVVEFGNKDDDKDYAGHDNESVVGLFPEVRILAAGDGALDPAFMRPAYMLLCAGEVEILGSWIDQKLADSLEALAELAVPSLPYQELSRAILDLDPRSLYMALYRCIEATYAFEHSSRLAVALGIPKPWYEVAAALDAEVSWHPLEANSLNTALTHADERDLTAVCQCLHQQVGKDLRASAGKAIYKLRNQIVHYRPTADPLVLESVDWNTICNLLVTIALDVFHRAYG